MPIAVGALSLAAVVAALIPASEGVKHRAHGSLRTD